MFCSTVFVFTVYFFMACFGLQGAVIFARQLADLVTRRVATIKKTRANQVVIFSFPVICIHR